MAKSTQKNITDAELDAALIEIKAEQRVWSISNRRAMAARAMVDGDMGTRTAIWIGTYLAEYDDAQRLGVR